MVLFLYFLFSFVYFIISYKVTFWQTNLLMNYNLGCPILFLKKSSFYHFLAFLLFFTSLSFPIISSNISIYFVFLNLFLYFLKDYLSSRTAKNKYVLELLPFYIEDSIKKGLPAEEININYLKEYIKNTLEDTITHNIKFKNY